TEGTLAPAIENVEGQRRLRRHRRMQCRRQRPRLEADPRNVLAGASGRGQWQAATVAGDDMARRVEALQLDLQALDRGIDEAGGAACGDLLTQDIPGFERLAQLQPNPAVRDLAVNRETELALAIEPLRIEAIALAADFIQHVEEILPDEILQHEAVVQCRAPAHHGAAKRLAPQPGDERAQQQLLGETHARIGRHLDRTEFDKAEAAGGAFRREQLVDADFGAVSIAGDIDQEIAKQPVDQPWQGSPHLSLPHLRGRKGARGRAWWWQWHEA